MCAEKSANCRAGMCLYVSLHADADASMKRALLNMLCSTSQVVGRSCLIFCHDGENNFDLESTCVLDTELLTLRKCGKMVAPSPQELVGAVVSVIKTVLSPCQCVSWI
jgi:hypothetical protein